MTTAWVFPGQGSQVVGMGRDLYQQFAVARDIFDQADATLDMKLAQLCFEGPEQTLTATENAQPALLTVSVALIRVIETLDQRNLCSAPQAIAGHSLGEYSALVAGKSLDFVTALQLVRRRGELMAAAREGTMAAVIGLDETVLDTICRDVSADLQDENDATSVVIANYNAPGQLVISGGVQAVEAASARAKDAGAKRVLPLKVSAAFHSPLMMSAAEGMAREIEHKTVADVTVPLIANVTAEPLVSAEDVRREIVSQVVAPVRWIASVQHMVDHGIETVVEIGPGKVLTSLIKRIAPHMQLANMSGVEDVRSFMSESY